MDLLSAAPSNSSCAGALFLLGGDKGDLWRALIGCSFLSTKCTMLVKTAVALLPLDMTLVLAVYVDMPLHSFKASAWGQIH